MPRAFLLSLSMCLAWTTGPAAASIVDVVLPKLKQLKPEAVWDTRSAVSMDIDCDGQPDLAILGRAPDRLFVAFFHGPVKAGMRPEILYFAPGHDQENVCSLNARVEPASLDYDPVEQEAGELPGFRRSAQCKAFTLADQECDSFNFYWNHDSGRLNWWRH